MTKKSNNIEFKDNTMDIFLMTVNFLGVIAEIKEKTLKAFGL